MLKCHKPCSETAAGLQKVQAAFFGVGAPEAALVVVTALIVFGPKGLAQVCLLVLCALCSAQVVLWQSCFCLFAAQAGAPLFPAVAHLLHSLLAAHLLAASSVSTYLHEFSCPSQAVKSLGATFRTISPSIRELVTASTDLRTSFEEQIGLDEIRNEFRGVSSPSYKRPLPESDADASTSSARDGSSSSSSNSSDSRPAVSSASSTEAGTSAASNGADQSNGAYFGADFDVDIEAKRREAAQLAWGTATGSDAPVAKDSSQASLNGPQSGETALAGLSLEALEAELARRKAAKAGSNGQSSNS